MERRAREAEMIAARIVEDSERRLVSQLYVINKSHSLHSNFQFTLVFVLVYASYVMCCFQ